MQREQVRSSQIRSVGYDVNDEILDIEFNNGSIYRYYDVPQRIHTELMNSHSVGAFFNKLIKSEYEYERLS